jgi:hypothetical protein
LLDHAPSKPAAAVAGSAVSNEAGPYPEICHSVYAAGPPSGTSTSTMIPVEFIVDVTPTRGGTWERLKLLYH